MQYIFSIFRIGDERAERSNARFDEIIRKKEELTRELRQANSDDIIKALRGIADGTGDRQ